MSKKTFKDSPALQFISVPQEHEAEQERIEQSIPPKGYKVDPKYIEVKSRRLQLVLQPSLYERVKRKAQDDGVSVNEFIHRLLDEATQ